MPTPDVLAVEDPHERSTLCREVLEALPGFWDEENPCVTMVKHLGSATLPRWP